MGQLTTVNVGTVATKTIDYALAGRSVYIPGAQIVCCVVGMLFPAPVMAGISNRRWRAARA